MLMRALVLIVPCHDARFPTNWIELQHPPRRLGHPRDPICSHLIPSELSSCDRASADLAQNPPPRHLDGPISVDVSLKKTGGKRQRTRRRR
jgi:hypothetical protein